MSNAHRVVAETSVPFPTSEQAAFLRHILTVWEPSTDEDWDAYDAAVTTLGYDPKEDEGETP